MAAARRKTTKKSTLIDGAHGLKRKKPSTSTTAAKSATPAAAKKVAPRPAPKKATTASRPAATTPTRTAAPKKTTARKSTTKRKSTAKKAAAPVVDPVLNKKPHERVWVLDDVPFGLRLPGAIYDKSRKQTIFIGSSLPPLCAPYSAKDYSLARWLEDDINGSLTPPKSVSPMTPRPDQATDIKVIANSVAAGHRGFFLTSQTGTGKTLVSVHGALAAAKATGKKQANVLVIANRPAAICVPDFRRTIQAVGDGGHRWLVTTVDRVHKADDIGVEWDVIIVDEAHGFRAVDTRRSKSLRSVTRAKLSNAAKAPFVLSMTATPAHDPTELTYLAPLLAQHHRENNSLWIGDKFPEALARHGFHIGKGRYGWAWTEKPDERAADVNMFRSWLESGTPKTLYRAAPWGDAPLEVVTTDLDPIRRAQYESDWADFQSEIEAARNAGRGDKGRAAVMRWRQKALVLRVPEISDWTLAQLELGNQVVLYTDFVGLGAEPLTEVLEAKVQVAKLFGTGIDHAYEKSRFDSGDAPVAVTTMSASINLQSGAIGPDGRKATMAPRVGVMTAPIYSGLKGRQVIGRTHRDGQVSPWLVMAASDSVEEQVARTMIGRFAASDGLAGADTAALKDVAELIGANWLDLSKDD
jgi:hypothetical protein